MEKNDEKKVKVELSDVELQKVAGGSGDNFDMMHCINDYLNKHPELRKTPDKGLSVAVEYCTSLTTGSRGNIHTL